MMTFKTGNEVVSNLVPDVKKLPESKVYLLVNLFDTMIYFSPTKEITKERAEVCLEQFKTFL